MVIILALTKRIRLILIYGCVVLQCLVSILYAKLARLREVETALACILHKYLHQASVIIRLAEVGI